MPFKFRTGTILLMVWLGVNLCYAKPLPPDKAAASDNTINNAVRLTWLPSKSPETVSYNIYKDGKFLKNTTGITYDDFDVIWGREYKYRITAVDHTGAENSPTPDFTGKSGDTEPPASSLTTTKNAPNTYGDKIYTNSGSISLIVVASDNPASKPSPRNAQSGIRGIKVWEDTAAEPRAFEEIESSPNEVGPKEYEKSVDLSPSQGERAILSKCQDQNNNLQTSTGRIKAVYDTEAPVLRSLQVEPKIAGSLQITLKWKSTDNFSPLVKSEILVSPLPPGRSVPQGYYGPLEASLPYQLPDKDGEYYIETSFTDLAGNVSNSLSETVILDRAPLEGTLTINAGAASTDKQRVTLRYTANKTEDRVQIYFSNDENQARNVLVNSPGWEPFGYGEKEWEIAKGPFPEAPAEPKKSTVYMRLKDNVSPPHISDLISASIYYGSMPPAEEAVSTLSSATAAGGMIDRVKINDKNILPGETIFTRAKIKIAARIRNEQGISSLILIDEKDGAKKEYPLTSYKSQKASKLDPHSLGEAEIEFEPSENLTEGEHTLSLKATDNTGNSEVFELTAQVSGIKIDGLIVPFPTPFSRSKDKEIIIQYTLAMEADVDINILSTSAETVKKIFCHKGEEGGKAGKNHVRWDVKSSLEEPLGQGMYLGIVTSKQDQKILGKFKVVVVQ